jgi:hypothetical protein
MKRFLALGATAAMIGGALRIVSAFAPYTPDSAWLEALYGVIDVALLLGLLGIGLFAADRLGAAGFGCFIVALGALASIVGPDAQVFGVDFYRAGAGIFVLALAGLAVALLRARLLIGPAGLWLASAAAGALSATGSTIAFAIAGVALGAGFLLAGAALRPTAAAAT